MLMPHQRKRARTRIIWLGLAANMGIDRDTYAHVRTWHELRRAQGEDLTDLSPFSGNDSHRVLSASVLAGGVPGAEQPRRWALILRQDPRRVALRAVDLLRPLAPGATAEAAEPPRRQHWSRRRRRHRHLLPMTMMTTVVSIARDPRSRLGPPSRGWRARS